MSNLVMSKIKTQGIIPDKQIKLAETKINLLALQRTWHHQKPKLEETRWEVELILQQNHLPFQRP